MCILVAYYPSLLLYPQSNILKLIQQCAFPPEAGGTGHCTAEDLGKARPVVQDMCNFYNATLYQDFRNCPQRLSERVTYEIIVNEDIVVSS